MQRDTLDGVKWARVLGIAGVVGVAATGVAVARAERRRRAYTPQDIRTRLHERHDDAVRTAAMSQRDSG
jgi:hypothetical protein